MATPCSSKVLGTYRSPVFTKLDMPNWHLQFSISSHSAFLILPFTFISMVAGFEGEMLGRTAGMQDADEIFQGRVAFWPEHAPQALLVYLQFFGDVDHGLCAVQIIAQQGFPRFQITGQESVGRFDDQFAPEIPVRFGARHDRFPEISCQWHRFSLIFNAKLKMMNAKLFKGRMRNAKLSGTVVFCVLDYSHENSGQLLGFTA